MSFSPDFEDKSGELYQNLRNEISVLEEKVVKLEGDILIMGQMAQEANSATDSMHKNLVEVSEELANIYNLVCTSNGEMPDRIMLNHAKGFYNSNSVSSLKIGTNTKKLNILQTKLKSKAAMEVSIEYLKSNSENETLVNSFIVSTISDQLSHLVKAIEKSLKMKPSKAHMDAPEISSPTDDDDDDLKSEVRKLKSLLSTRSEQNATLRVILKENKQISETAHANLKAMYETERAGVDKTLNNLRNELKLYKENAAYFSFKQAEFIAYREDYAAQIDELQGKLLMCEKEKASLRTVLSLALTQRITLNKKIDSKSNISRVKRPSSQIRNLSLRNLSHRSTSEGGNT